VGDCGKKLGYNSTDNGYLMFDHVSVPRNAHMSRFAAISKEGDFEIMSDPRLLYQIMTQTRLFVIRGGAYYYLRSCLTAVRYAVCRRQFANLNDSKRERKLLDYQVH